MNNIKFGFIGCGNMGGALARAVCKSVGADNTYLADKDVDKVQALANELKCNLSNNGEICEKADFIFLGVKPQIIKTALDEIADILKDRKDRFVLVSMAAGVEIAKINQMLGANYPIIRIMPNTPVCVGAGMILYAVNNEVSTNEITEFLNALSFAGKLDLLDETLINAGTAVSGCGPAFVYMFAEAMADAGAKCGLPKEKAIQYAAQTLLGASQLMLKSNKQPSVLRDEVCSPGGSTIEGVHALQENGFAENVSSAVKASFDKTNKL